MKRNITARAIDGQVAINRSGVGHAASFAGHRTRLTAEIVLRAPQNGAGRLCLLGAGNTHDVDLGVLVARFAEVHLVDVDIDAVRRARELVPVPARDRVRLHAPVEVSGTWELLDEWSRRPMAVEILQAQVAPAVARVLAALPGPFDVVVSCCLLTELHLVLLTAVNDRHPSFDALRAMQNAIHVRVLAGLLGPAGRALLITDLTSDATYPFDALELTAPTADLGRLMSDLVAVGNVIHAAHPGLLSAEIRRDPALAVEFAIHCPVGPWLWHNGPERIFLVYGLEISRKKPRAEDLLPLQSGPSVTASSATVSPPSPQGRGGPEMSLTNVIEIDDVIPALYQDQIENSANALPWYFHPESARPDLNFTSNYGGFFHLAYDAADANPVTSAINAILVPLLFIFCDKAKIKFETLLRVRLGLFTRDPTEVAYHNPHVDFYQPHNVALYYVNDSDGDTVVFDETSDKVDLQRSASYANQNKFTEIRRISPKKGRMVWFDGNRYHASMHPRRHASRIVVTFNFK
jgi:hypothetical protein